MPLFRGVAKAAFYCAHRTAVIHSIDPSKLARIHSLGRAPTLVYVRPSNEGLLRPRVPGAQDQRGRPSSFSLCGLTGPGDLLAFPPLTRLPHSHRFSWEGGPFGLPLRASNEHLPSVRVARAQEANRPPSPFFLL